MAEIVQLRPGISAEDIRDRILLLVHELQQSGAACHVIAAQLLSVGACRAVAEDSDPRLGLAALRDGERLVGGAVRFLAERGTTSTVA